MLRALSALVLALDAAPARADLAPLGDHAARTVVVLVFEGLPSALLEEVDAPAFERMRREGVSTHSLDPVFPTLPVVGGFSLSTGCRPERHGIVSDRFRDPQRGRFDHSRDADWQIGCEGMHEAAERQGVRTAALGWYGGVSKSRGALATYVSDEKSAPGIPLDLERAQEVVRLLALAERERPRLILASFRGPDEAVRARGLDSEAARAAARAADEALGSVLAAIDSLPDRDRFVLFAVSAEGARPATTMLNLDRVLARRSIAAKAETSGGVALLYLDDPAAVEGAERSLREHPQLEVFRPASPLAWAKLGSGPRAGDLVLAARPSIFIEDGAILPAWARHFARFAPESFWGGFLRGASNGYPPGTPGVAGLLYARGSGIARGRRLDSARVVDLHPTVLDLLLLDPGDPVDGRVLSAIRE